MAFQPNAFQLDAFQWASNNATRSGVIRLWLSELTAELNDLNVKPEEAKKEEKRAVKVRFVSSPSKDTKPFEAKVTRTPKEYNDDGIKVVALPLRAMHLPAPQDTALYLLEKIATDVKVMSWTESDVLYALKEAIEEREEDEIISKAVEVMFG
jgi:hypothetical protein